MVISLAPESAAEIVRPDIQTGAIPKQSKNGKLTSRVLGLVNNSYQPQKNTFEMSPLLLGEASGGKDTTSYL